MFYEIYQWLKELERRFVQEGLTGEDAIRRDLRKVKAMKELEKFREDRKSWLILANGLERSLESIHRDGDWKNLKKTLQDLDRARAKVEFSAKQIVELKKEWFVKERDPRDPE